MCAYGVGVGLRKGERVRRRECVWGERVRGMEGKREKGRVRRECKRERLHTCICVINHTIINSDNDSE